MLVGYMRILTQDRDLTTQRTALQQAGCSRICQDSLKNDLPQQPSLQMALQLLRKGDTLVVLSLECLGYGVKQLISLVRKLERQGVHFKSLSDQLDSRVDPRDAFFDVIERLSKMERRLFLEMSEKKSLSTEE